MTTSRLDPEAEELIATSYRRRYAKSDLREAQVLARLSSFSVAACRVGNSSSEHVD
jgi:hypothetical protein